MKTTALVSVASVVLAALTLGSPAALAAPGDLDPTFGVGGKAIIAPIILDTGFATAYALVRQPDGKLAVAGYGFVLVRYTADGSLDPAFGVGGVVTTSIGRGPDAASALVLQPDGKLVAAGGASNGTDEDFALVRYNTDGSLDPSFGVGGVVTTSIGPGNEEVSAVVLQPDGKLVAAGSASNGTDRDFALVRYTATGKLDPSFGKGGTGTVTTPIGPGGDWAGALVLQPDGKLVVAGETFNGTDYDFALVRYTASGKLDPTFGVGGKVTTPIGPGDDAAGPVVLQPDGKLVVAGETFNGTDYDFALMRYTASGKLDPTFGVGGKVTTSIGPGDDVGAAVILQPDGKLVVAGGTSNPTDGDFALVRYDPDGSLDPGFGVGGKVTTSFGPGYDLASAVILQPDGKLVAAGHHDYINVALARYLGPPCGNGITEAPEECDDGNTVNGDGCDADCRVECGLPMGAVKLTVTKLNTLPGDDTLSLQVTTVLPIAVSPWLNPLAGGVRVLLTSNKGSVLDVTLPAGAFATPPGTGWTVNKKKTQWTYQDKTPAPAGGIYKVVVQDKPTVSPTWVKFTAKGKHGSYAMAPTDLPVTGHIVLDLPTGQCMGRTLICSFNKSGSTLTCK